jgi:RNA polymerase sigma factor (sigma-70 family)
MMTPTESPAALNSLADTPDGELLRRFSSRKEEAAFCELVLRHSGMVISTAFRRGGSWELAQEAAQNVFTSLSRKAARLAGVTAISPWLHRAAVLEAAALLRRETRYRHAMNRSQQDPSRAIPTVSMPVETVDHWEPVRPLVDEALNALSTADREMLLLHHVEGRTFRDIATRLGLTAEAAQRRGHRALEKLTSRLRRRGVVVPVLALDGILTAGFTQDAAAVSAPCRATLIAHGKSLAAGTGNAASATPFPPASWMAKPAMLAAAGMISASLPILWHARAAGWIHSGPPPGASLPAAAGREGISTNAPTTSNPEAQLAFFKEALDRLKQTPPDGGPTKLGLQLRKFLLALNPDDLRPVGKIMRGSPRSHREMMALLEAFSTRLAELEPALALELAKDGGVRHPDADFNNSVDKMALLDVLTRQSEPAFLKAAQQDKDFGFYAILTWAAHDPAGVMEYVEHTLEGKLQESGYRKCLGVWMDKNPAAAYRWLDQRIVDQPDVLEQTYSFLFEPDKYAVIHQLPAQEAVALAISLRDPVLRNPLIGMAFIAYSQDQPQVLAAFAPLLRLEDNAKPLSVQQVVQAWRRKDDAGAVAWVENLPEGGLKTTARRCLAEPLPPDFR